MTFHIQKVACALAIGTLISGCAVAQNPAPQGYAAPVQNTYATQAQTNSYASPVINNYAQRTDVQNFVRMMANKYGYSEVEMLKVFDKTQRLDTVLSLLEKDKPNPNFKKNWASYRKRYIEPIRIKAGVDFWNKNASTLTRATKQYGVPEHIIVGILGVETIYGRIMGDNTVFDVLTTLAFDYPRRSAEYMKFLEEFMVLCRENNMPMRSVKGSYAGAIGLPQFMPDSWRDYGVDFDGDGKVDLRNSSADAIGSVARFLSQKGGWIPGQDVVYSVDFDIAKPNVAELKAQVEPIFTIKQLNQYGVTSPENIRPDVKLSLIDLPNGDNPTSYLLGSRNFYAITRYNKSYMYAMSVYDLGTAVAKARAK